MKLQFRQIESFVKSPDKAARVILVYGPDDGLMRERAETMGKTVVSDLNDPFNVADLTADILAEDPARLSDEAGAISMMGGDRLIRVSDASDKLTPLIKEYLENPSNAALVILMAGGLGPRSSLRLLCEKAKNAAAVPCYVEDERDLGRFITETLQVDNLRIERDAVTWLAGNIAGDRQKARREVEKLAVYKGAEDGPITLADVQAACGQAGAQGLDELIYAVAGGQPEKALQAFYILTADGVPFMAALRSLQNHFRRLHYIKAQLAAGDPLDSAMKKLRPPIFFKQEPAFKAQLQKWSLPALQNILQRLLELEAQCKQTGSMPDIFCAQAVLGISAARR